MIRLLEKGEEIPYDLLLLADETREAINRYIFQSKIWVLVQDHKMIAVYVLQKIDSDTQEIKNIAVKKDHQGQGISQMLLTDAAERTKKSGYKKLILGTGDASIKQLYLYQKAGFEIFDIKHRFFLEN